MKTITPPQAVLIAKIAAERDPAALDAILIAKIDMAAHDGLSIAEASALIDTLLTKALKPRNAAEQAKPGYFVTDGGDVIVVVENKAKTGTYAKVLKFSVGEAGKKTAAWVYAPGVGKTLAGLEPLTVEQAAALGHKHGICVICAKALTDPKSVERGIGPVCAKRLGPVAVAA